MAKKKIRKLIGLGLLTGVGSVAVSSLPANAVSPNVAIGLGKFSAVFPASGALLGTGVTIGAAGSLVKATEGLKLKRKGGKKIAKRFRELGFGYRESF